MTTVYVRADSRPTAPPPPNASSNEGNRLDIESDELGSQLVEILADLGRLGEHVPIERWCLVGGLMVELRLRERGRASVRPTTDGDIVGDVRAQPTVLRAISRSLSIIGYEMQRTGWEADIGVRHKRGDNFIDVLAPANTDNMSADISVGARARPLRAPGSDHALATAAPLAISVDGGAPVVVRVPTVAGALYAKVSGWKEIGSPDSTKHLVDAAQLLAAATIADLDATTNGIPPKALQKRLRWLEEALEDERSSGWGSLSTNDRSDALERLRFAIR